MDRGYGEGEGVFLHLTNKKTFFKERDVCSSSGGILGEKSRWEERTRFGRGRGSWERGRRPRAGGEDSCSV